jgi:protein-tyrosine-phosphatase
LNILLVCTGNICRSTMAEAFMRDELKAVNGRLEIAIASVGLQAEEGSTPPAEVIAVMREMGFDVSGHRARQLRGEDVKAADLILTMAMHNSSRLLTAYQEAVDRVFTIKEFVIQGEEKGRELEERDPEKRLNELRGWIRRIEGLEMERGGADINEHLRLFLLHYFHIYDHSFTIDDPLGQSMDFMRRTAQEIQDAVQRLVGADLLALTAT